MWDGIKWTDVMDGNYFNNRFCLENVKLKVKLVKCNGTKIFGNDMNGFWPSPTNLNPLPKMFNLQLGSKLLKIF